MAQSKSKKGDMLFPGQNYLSPDLSSNANRRKQQGGESTPKPGVLEYVIEKEPVVTELYGGKHRQHNKRNTHAKVNTTPAIMEDPGKVHAQIFTSVVNSDDVTQAAVDRCRLWETTGDQLVSLMMLIKSEQMCPSWVAPYVPEPSSVASTPEASESVHKKFESFRDLRKQTTAKGMMSRRGTPTATASQVKAAQLLVPQVERRESSKETSPRAKAKAVRP